LVSAGSLCGKNLRHLISNNYRIIMLILFGDIYETMPDLLGVAFPMSCIVRR